ncbi:Uncharacterised protein [Serratia rubidaea]|uniref:NAD(P)-binding domain-containing protein n=1 Tax=Serratia rubidaea TaxID=61652 RepID=A0A4U9HGA7_SERRU|nr:Uncharacterised protein [Serratia rubidaea]
MAVKKQADVHLAASPLDWVILRPGTLTNNAGSGRINAGLAIPYGLIPREDVAATLAALIDTLPSAAKLLKSPQAIPPHFRPCRRWLKARDAGSPRRGINAPW